ncbi:hypothetical protein LUZ63_000003 [Rhynchospora breviuscula]|uniref:Uncharacterized protein n=1 Tax=Rhynchospora breviuscula TaxID=2022672 RepID=A0A9Q0CU43_9POAL|nr:hypothetical protein LUZ63_000003 [Rhynchospora breviuscula]
MEIFLNLQSKGQWISRGLQQSDNQNSTQDSWGYHRNWHEKLPEALWAYRITYRTPTQATPYSLVYGTEAVLPIEVELPSLRVAMVSEIPLTKQMQLKLQELDGMDERRLAAQQNLELYQARMIRAYEKLSRARAFRKGELVLVLR